jgi:hypothetical protein
MQKWSFRFRLRCKKKENKILNNESQFTKVDRLFLLFLKFGDNSLTKFQAKTSKNWFIGFQ